MATVTLLYRRNISGVRGRFILGANGIVKGHCPLTGSLRAEPSTRLLGAELLTEIVKSRALNRECEGRALTIVKRNCQGQSP
jgi:hypothetical protein